MQALASRGINVNRMAGMKILEAGHRKDGHMSRIIGDRTRNTLDEMEEVSRQFNEECNEEERRKADKNKVKNKEEAGRAKAPSKSVIIPAGRSDYLMVEFEALVPMQNTRDWDNLDKTATITEKAGFIYGKSLERLRISRL